MGGIVGKYDQRLLAVPEADHADGRVDDPLGGSGPPGRASCSSGCRSLTVRAEHPSVRGNVLDRRLPQAEMRDCLRLGERSVDCSSGAGKKLAVETGKIPLPGLAALNHQILCTRVKTGCIVLVQAVHSDPVLGRGRRICEGLSPRFVALAGNPDPVDRAKNDRLLVAQEDDAAAFERVVDALGFLDSASQSGVPRGGVTSNSKVASLRAGWPPCAEVKTGASKTTENTTGRGHRMCRHLCMQGLSN